MSKPTCEVCNKITADVIDQHHIHSLSLGGHDNDWNKANICCNCHRLVHRGKVILEGRFASSSGEVLVWRVWDKPSITGVVDPPVYLMGKGK